MDEWSLIEKKIPSFDLIFAVDPAHVGGVGARAVGRAAAPAAAARRHAATSRQVIDESGLVEFEVGKALFGLITAGFAHRVGTSAAAAPKVNDGRVDEHRNLGIAFYKAGDARRGAARVPPRGRAAARATPARRSTSASSRVRQARWEEAADGLPAGRRRGGRQAGRAPQPRATRSSGWAGSTRPRPPTATPPARARDDARIMLGWSVVALKRGEHQVAQGRLARALELLGGKPAPALWYWAATLASAGLDDDAGRAPGGPRRRRGATPSSAVLQNNLAVLLELSGDVAGRRDGAPRGAGGGSVAAPDLQESGRHPLPQRPLRGGARGLRARRQAGARSRRRPLLQARQHRLQAARQGAGPRELEPGHRRSIPATSWPGPTSRCWTWRHDRPTTRRSRRSRARSPGRAASPLEAYKDKCIRRRIAVRMRACGVHTYDDYRALLDAIARRVRAAARRAHDQRHPVLSERGDLESAPARRCCPTLFDRPRVEMRVWSAGCSSGEEPYTLAALVADRLDQAGRGGRAHPADDRRHRHRPRQPRAGPRRPSTAARA